MITEHIIKEALNNWLLAESLKCSLDVEKNGLTPTIDERMNMIGKFKEYVDELLR